jgi:HAD superfamily hydrolase (TIGR01509 family)
MKPPISFVYFDVGGVALLDFSGTNGWNELLDFWHIDATNKAHFDMVWKKYSPRLCVDPTSELLTIPGFVPSNPFDFVKDFADRFEANPAITPLLEKLQTENIPFGLLTNMYPTMFDHISHRALLPPFRYQVIVDSSKELCEKPFPEIYTKAQNLCGFSGNQILFVDNVHNNLVPAEALGWQTFLYDSTQPVASTTALTDYIFGRQ